MKEQTREGGAVKDPVVVTTKGAPRLSKKNKGRKRRCTICRCPGHTKRHCRREPLEGMDGASMNKNGESELASHGSSPGFETQKTFAKADEIRKPNCNPESSSSDDYLQQVWLIFILS
ncbi:hypothetical protein PIB30_103309 [Stylosanthes scabra]|uniref:Uncharacterized protein n=1 Tax=Stylosanthes scabra TaxID=79078 RepID=A0ABU6RYK6_9FABA|nr:hypothetical protein [Stylosanthes scabra]